MTVPDGAPPRRRTLAERIDHLFRTVHPRGQGEYSYDDVAMGIRKRGGPTISSTYLWQLRKGLRDNPTMKHLEALADFFGVSPLYFFDDEATDRIDQQLAFLALLRDSPVKHLALRAIELSPESLAKIADMVEFVRQLEGMRDGGSPRSGGVPAQFREDDARPGDQGSLPDDQPIARRES